MFTKNINYGCDLEKWFRVSHLIKGRLRAPPPPPPSVPCSVLGSQEGLVSVVLALRTKPQEEAKLVNRATGQHRGDE